MNNIERRERDAKILKMKEEGYSIREIGEAFGLCRSSISQICTEQKKKRGGGRSARTAKQKDISRGRGSATNAGLVSDPRVLFWQKNYAPCAAPFQLYRYRVTKYEL